jgi:hypothetical protein
LLEKLNAVQEEAKVSNNNNNNNNNESGEGGRSLSLAHISATHQSIDGGRRLLDIELQSGSSAYTLYFVDAYITNTYSNITNILVRVPARNKPVGTAPAFTQSLTRCFHRHDSRASGPCACATDAYSPLLLINSHFDSGVGATGASDDGVATVRYLQRLRVHSLYLLTPFSLSLRLGLLPS